MKFHKVILNYKPRIKQSVYRTDQGIEDARRFVSDFAVEGWEGVDAVPGVGEDTKLWRDRPRYCAGVVASRIASGRTEVRLLGVGANWREAVISIDLSRALNTV